jgi:hypothetical protein
LEWSTLSSDKSENGSTSFIDAVSLTMDAVSLGGSGGLGVFRGGRGGPEPPAGMPAGVPTWDVPEKENDVGRAGSAGAGPAPSGLGTRPGNAGGGCAGVEEGRAGSTTWEEEQSLVPAWKKRKKRKRPCNDLEQEASLATPG